MSRHPAMTIPESPSIASRTETSPHDFRNSESSYDRSCSDVDESGFDIFKQIREEEYDGERSASRPQSAPRQELSRSETPDPPPSRNVASRRESPLRETTSEGTTVDWALVERLEAEVLAQHAAWESKHVKGGGDDRSAAVGLNKCRVGSDGASKISLVFCRDGDIGLGMTLSEAKGLIYVHALTCHDGTRVYARDKTEEELKDMELKKIAGPSHVAGVRPGDRILGVNGKAFLLAHSREETAGAIGNESHHSSGSTNKVMSDSSTILKNAVQCLMRTPDPVVLHLERFPNGKDNADVNPNVARAPQIHPLGTALSSRNLLQSKNDNLVVTMQLSQFTERAAQWESTSFLRIDPKTNSLRHFDPRDHMPSDYANEHSLRKCAPSTSQFAQPMDKGSLRKIDVASSFMNEDRGYDPNKATKSHNPGMKPGPFQAVDGNNDIFIPLMGVRKGLCVRIVNSFLDDDRTAYTIWVYDIESGKEWYAPVRYYRDFKDLRSATSRLNQSILNIPFPTMGWGVWPGNEASESGTAKESRCKLLEIFLRTLCGLVYTGTLHARMSEVAIHLQSFLGCDTCLDDNESGGIILDHHVALNEKGYNTVTPKDDSVGPCKLSFQRSIQRYTNRLFLLPIFEQLVRQFIDATKTSTPSMDEMMAMDRKSKKALKESAQEDLNNVRDFLDQMQDLIVEGCMDDFLAISRREAYKPLTATFDKNGGSGRESVIVECVREQVEIEIYVPLRSVISRHLVNGWRHDDLEMQFKMQELKKRPQSFFKVLPHHQSPSQWSSAANIIKDGVGRSTLPCEKLCAIVETAKEITRLSVEERLSHSDILLTPAKSHGKRNEKDSSGMGESDRPSKNGRDRNNPLGADDFLPIFIFCVVQAELERPCALCVLLRTLCEPSKRIGETGYYLASFEAAVAHIRELDLTEGIANR